MSNYLKKILYPLILVISLNCFVLSGCNTTVPLSPEPTVMSIVDEYDKEWLQSGRDKFVFHKTITKSEHLGEGWKLDENAHKTRFPWPRFTKSGGIIKLNWNHRMERRINIRLLNVNPSYPADFLNLTLNGHPLTQMSDELPIGEFSFYLPSAYQLQGENQLKIAIKPDFSDNPEDFNSVGLHSIRVTLGAVVRNVIRIGDQVRRSLLFAPPIAIQIPYDSQMRHRLNFSYGLYSFTPDSDTSEYELEVKLLEFERSKELYSQSILIKGNTNATRMWQSSSLKIPATSKRSVLEISFKAISDTVSSDYLALSEMFLSPERKHFSLKPQNIEPDVLLVTLSSVSTNQLGCYGNPTAHTPFIDRQSQYGILHADMTAASNDEVSSLVSIATGKYPRDHGFYRSNQTIDPSWTTIPDVFLNASFQSHGYLHTEHTSQQPIPKLKGFRRVYLTNPTEQPLSLVMKQFTESLNSPFLRSDQGFFWVHLAPEFNLADAFSKLNPLDSYSKESLDIQSLNLPVSEQQRLLNLTGTRGDDLRYLLADTDNRLSRIDAFISALVKQVKNRRKKRELILLVQSDHGIIRSVTSNPLSSDSLSQEVIHVPFVVSSVGKPQSETRSRILSQPVSSIKVFDLLTSLSRHPELGTAETVFEQALNRNAISPIFSEHNQRPIVAYRKKGHKMIHCLSDPYFQIATTNLFDLNANPSESVNLAGKDPTFTRQFLEPVLAFCRSSDTYPEPQPGLDEEALQILKSLNYVDTK